MQASFAIFIIHSENPSRHKLIYLAFYKPTVLVYLSDRTGHIFGRVNEYFRTAGAVVSDLAN